MERREEKSFVEVRDCNPKGRMRCDTDFSIGTRLPRLLPLRISLSPPHKTF